MGKKFWIIPVVVSICILIYGIVATTRMQGDVFWLPIGIVSFTMTIIWFTIFGPMVRNRRILRTGESGMARVLRMFETGVTVNSNPMVKLEVEVTPQRGATYVTTTKVVVSRLNPMMYGPGTVVPIKIDPKDAMTVVIDTSGSVAATSQSPNAAHIDKKRNEAMSELLEAANKIRVEVLESPTSKEAQGTIVSLWSLDVTINSMAVGMEFLVEVDIPGRPPFKTEIKGAVANTNLAKYQIGTRLTLKYDPADPVHRIAVVGVV